MLHKFHKHHLLLSRKQKKKKKKTVSNMNQSVPVDSSPPHPSSPPLPRLSARAVPGELDNEFRILDQSQRSQLWRLATSPVGDIQHQQAVPLGTSKYATLENVEEEEEDISVSGTQLEADSIVPDEVIEQIPELNFRSDLILESLVSVKTDYRTLLRHLRQPGHPSGRRLRQKQKFFELVKESFGTTTFINPRTLAKVISHDIFRPILYKSNMATLSILLCTAPAAENSHQHLMNLERVFPMEFTENRLDDELTADLLLEIRTQLFISALPEFQEDLKPDEILAHFFLEDDENQLFRNVEGQQWMLGKKPKNWTEISDGSKEHWLARLADIRGTYDEEIYADSERLMRIYSWDDFVGTVLAYIRREVDLLHQFDDEDDISQIQKLVSIAQVIAETAAQSQHESQHESQHDTQQAADTEFNVEQAHELGFEESDKVEFMSQLIRSETSQKQASIDEVSQSNQIMQRGEAKVVSSIEGIAAFKSASQNYTQKVNKSEETKATSPIHEIAALKKASQTQQSKIPEEDKTVSSLQGIAALKKASRTQQSKIPEEGKIVSSLQGIAALKKANQIQQSKKSDEIIVVFSSKGISALKQFASIKSNPFQLESSGSKLELSALQIQAPQKKKSSPASITKTDNAPADYKNAESVDQTSTSVTQQFALYKKIQDNRNKENRVEAESSAQLSTGPEPSKKVSWTDRQEGAVRVIWNGDEEELMATQLTPQVALDKGKKRAIEQVQFDDEEEENDYGPDNRPQDEERMKMSRVYSHPNKSTLQENFSRGESPTKRRKLNGSKVSQPQVPLLPPPRPPNGTRSPKRIMSKSLPSQEVPGSSQQGCRGNRSVSLLIKKSGNRRHTAPVGNGDRNRRKLPEEFGNDMPSVSLENKDNDLHGEHNSDSDMEVNLNARVKWVAKRNRELLKKKEPIKKRRKWTKEEEDKLIEKIAEHGCKWCLIQFDEEPLLAGRTQMMLKDKARNLKFAYLKACQSLPPNFEHVTLSQKHINELADMGIIHEYKGHYEREGDNGGASEKGEESEWDSA